MRSSLVARHAPGLLSLALLAAGVVAGVAWTSSANSTVQMAPAPAVIGVVNLEKLSTLLTEMKDRNTALNSRNQPRVDELKNLDTQLAQTKKELSDLPPSASKDKRMELTLKAIELEAMFDTKKRAYQQAAGIESGGVLRDVYMKILASAKRFAESNGYDLILLDDRGAELPENRSADDYSRVITSTKLMFAKESLDVTDALATLMNNDYTATGGKSAPPAPPASKKK
jgi:Skp family chaperone for outer membrane proteins